MLGNRIGAGVTGDALPTPDSNGIADLGASGAIIGGVGDGNTVTGQKYGVVISNKSFEIGFYVAETVDGESTTQYYALAGTDTPAKFSNATVKGNIIGPLPGGRNVPTDGEQDGIFDSGGQGDVIGPDNTLAWNGVGLSLDGTNDVQIVGNRIGTDVSGLDALPNGIGVEIEGSGKTGLGFAGDPDTISGNRLGVLDNGQQTRIEAELIGPTSLGNTELKPFKGSVPAVISGALKGEAPGGVVIGDKGKKTIIGGDGKGEGVVIGGNDGTGLVVQSHTVIDDDHVGVGRDGTSALPNAGDGIIVKNAPETGIVESIIAHSDKIGIVVEGRHGALIDGTPIFDNRLGGIKIASSGAAAAPAKLISAVNNGAGTEIRTDLKVPKGDTGEIQYWATPTCEAGGAGKKLLDTSDDLHAGAHYNIKEETADTEAVGTAVTATLTVGHGKHGATSEFSDCAIVKPSH